MNPIRLLVIVFIICGTPPGFAHSPICDCYDNGDMTVTCEGGFSDGASAAGSTLLVMNMSNKILLEGKMDESSSLTFDLPEQDYYVVFDAGSEHRVEIYGEDIFE